MANRLFLTLLALLTGLAAQLAPAQARVCAEQTTSVTISAPSASRYAAAAAELAHLPVPGRRHARLVADQAVGFAEQRWRAPSVRIRVDRAHE